MKLRFAPRARNDINQIHEYISQHNASAAIAVVRRIRATCQLLARYPGLGRQTDIPEVRVFPISRYPHLVYHRVDGTEVTIVHVRDGRRDKPKSDEI